MSSGSVRVGTGSRTSIAFVAFLAAALLGIAAFTSPAQADQVRGAVLQNGLNPIEFRVNHTTRDLPPAIVFSTRPAGQNCTVRNYRYGNQQSKGRFSVRLFCRGLSRNARARFLFRAPYKRKFDLRNGTHVIRVTIDKPRGRALPLGSLTTRPRNTDCDVNPAGKSVGSDRFRARARMTCRGIEPGSTGVLGIGGLLSPDREVRIRSRFAGAVADTSRPADFATRARVPDGQCETQSVVEIKPFKTLYWKDCYTGSFTLGPWQTQWIGIGGPHPQCQDGWSRQLNLWNAPPQYLVLRKTGLEMDTNPESWWYSWYNITGTVTNWQFSGDVNFRFVYRCFRTE